MIKAGIWQVELHARDPVRGALVLLALLSVIAVTAFWPSIAALAELWSHPDRRTYQHGYLIAAIALWMLLRERRQIARAAGPPAPALLVVAAGTGLAWAVARNAGLQTVHFLLWPAVLWAAMAGVLGLRAGRVMLLPIAYLYFAMPIWDALSPFLQSATVLANNVLATAVGMPVLIEGNFIHIPEGSFEIAGGCSGLNYLVVGLAIAALLGEINREPPARRLLLIAVGCGLALFSNWLRVFIIVVAGHLSDMDHYLVRVDHYNFGWVLYAFVLALFFYIARMLPHPAARTDLTGTAVPASHGPRVLPAVAAIFAIVLGPLLAGNNDATSTDYVGVARIELKDAPEWQAAPAIGDWVPEFPGADAESLVDFSRGSERVTAYTATYVRQVQGRELIGHNSRIEGRSAGRLARTGPQPAAGNAAVRTMEAEWRSAAGARALIWWTYRVGSRDFTSELPAQLWYGWVSLWSDPVSAIVALRSECRPDCEHARLALQEFATVALPDLLVTASRMGDRIE